MLHVVFLLPITDDESQNSTIVLSHLECPIVPLGMHTVTRDITIELVNHLCFHLLALQHIIGVAGPRQRNG